MRRCLPVLALVVTVVLTLAAAARADRKYFVNSYTSYLAPAGTLELESWAVAAYGQGDSANTAWVQKVEFEYAISDRFTGSAYLNFQQAGVPESPVHFEGPSLEA